jgi:hypothetical protein
MRQIREPFEQAMELQSSDDEEVFVLKLIYLLRLFKLCTAVILLFSFNMFYANRAFAQLSCRNLFQDTVPKSQNRLSSTVESFRSLKPSDLLTLEFINKLEQSVGPVQIKFSNEASQLSDKLVNKVFKTQNDFAKDIKSLTVSVTAGSKSVINFTLYFNKKSDYVAVDGLEVTNPMVTQTENLHMSQSSKGVSVTEFNKAKTMIIESLKKQDWRGVLCVGTTHYLVSMLYQRFIRMKPTESSIHYYNYLERIQKSFSSSEAFYKALGSVKPDMMVIGIEQSWSTVRNTEDMLQKGFAPIYKDDQIIAVTYTGKLANNESRTYIIDPQSSGKSFLLWSRMMSLGQTELVLDF